MSTNDPPRSLGELVGRGRFLARTAGFVGVTFGMYGLLEVDTAASPSGEREVVLHKWIRRYGKALVRLFGVEVVARGPYVDRGEVYPGRDARGKGRIFVMNHRSGLDVPITLAYVESAILSRADLAHWPVIGVAARRVGTVFVDRSNKQSGATAINVMVETVESGRGVMIYPEGTTFEGDEVRPFRAGAFLAAMRTDAEIVPVGLAYAGEASSFGEETFAQHMMRVSAAPRTRAAIVVGDPLRVGSDDVDVLRERVRGEVQALVHEARRLLDAQVEGNA